MCIHPSNSHAEAVIKLLHPICIDLKKCLCCCLLFVMLACKFLPLVSRLHVLTMVYIELTASFVSFCLFLLEVRLENYLIVSISLFYSLAIGQTVSKILV